MFVQVEEEYSKNLLNLKRENFHVSVRKSKREEIFNQKRNIFLLNNKEIDQFQQLKIYFGVQMQNFDQNSFLQLVSQKIMDLESIINQDNVIDKNDIQIACIYQCFEYLKENLPTNPENVNKHVVIVCLKFIELISFGRKSFLYIDDENEQLKDSALETLLQFLINITYHRQDLQQCFVQKEETFIYLIINCKTSGILNQVLYILFNVLHDDASQISVYLKRDIMVKIVNQIYELQCFNQLCEPMLLVFQALTKQSDLVSTFQTNFILLQIKQTIKDNDSAQNLKYICLCIIQNITDSINDNGQRLNELFQQLQKSNIIDDVVNILLNDQTGLFVPGWKILYNLSLITLNSMIDYLIKQNQILLPISHHINQEEKIQSDLYLTLANLFSSNIFIKDQIIAQGLVSRICTGYESLKEKHNYQLLRNIMYCIINAVNPCSQEQLNYFYDHMLLQCMVYYFMDFNQEYWEISLIDELIETIKYACDNNLEFLLFCQQSSSFIECLHFLLKNNQEEINQELDQLISKLQEGNQNY